MMTAQQLALDCLVYSGVYNILPVVSTEPFANMTERTAILNWIARDISAVLQWMYRERPDLFRRRIGVLLGPPVTGSVPVVYGSTALGSTPFTGVNVDGCTLQINGLWNEARQTGTTLSLLTPYSGPTQPITPPMITVQPVSHVVNPGSTISLSVAATGTAPLTYQWYWSSSDHANAPIYDASSGWTGTQTSVLTVPNFDGGTDVDGGSYTCLVSNAGGTVVSAAASLSPPGPTLTGPTQAGQQTGVASAPAVITAYSDCVPLGSTVGRILGEVYRDNVVPLVPMANRHDYNIYNTWRCGDYGMNALVPRPVQHIPGTPVGYWTEAEQTPTGAVLRLHVTPIPAFSCSLDFDVEVRVVTVPMVGGLITSPTNAADPLVMFGLPDGFDEAVLRPLVLARYATSPWFKSEEKAKVLPEEAAAAKLMLRDYQVQAAGGSMLTHGWQG